MVGILITSDEQVVRSCRAILAPTQEADGESSAALVSERKRVHEITAWTLWAMQEKPFV
jgi:starvation-inducible DNA-binding protein